jgi:hypothetical protein
MKRARPIIWFMMGRETRSTEQETDMSSLNASVLQAINDDYRKRMVWLKGTPIPGCDPAIWRYDAFGKILRFSDYGDRSSEYGWEIDHYPAPAALGGTDDISNLRPLHCGINASLGGGLAHILAQSGRGGGGLGSR